MVKEIIPDPYHPFLAGLEQNVWHVFESTDVRLRLPNQNPQLLE